MPTWGRAGSGAGRGRGSCPRSKVSLCISSVSLGASPEPVSWGEAGRAEREGLGGDGCWSPPTSHLPPLALRTRSLLLLAGTGPAWPSDLRPGSRELPLSVAPIHPDAHLWPRGPFLNLAGPSGVRMAGEPEGQVLPRSEGPSSWATESQGARRPPRKRARRDPPPKSSPSARKVRPDPGRS